MGCVIDVSVLIQEIQGLEAKGISLKGRLHISSFAQLIMPYHRELDLWQEEIKGALSIGTTKKGIGPCYADKASRVGIQLGELLNFSQFETHLAQISMLKNLERIHVFNKAPIDLESIKEEYRKYALFLKPYISSSAEKEIAEAVLEGKKVLLEGAHGAYLDQTFGTYPYVTSSSTIASGVACGAGVGPSKIDHVVGVVKAYTTRVGNGPLPTALTQEDSKLFLNNVESREIATTTGRKRRMGWFDVPLVKNSLRWSGVDSIALTKLDVLDCLAEIKVCIAYKLEGKEIDQPPAMTCDWESMEPVYEILPGWQESTKNVSSYEDLPKNAKAYLKKIESLCKCPISLLSYGPQRDKIIHLRQLF